MIATSFWRPLVLFGPYAPLVALTVIGLAMLSCRAWLDAV